MKRILILTILLMSSLAWAASTTVVVGSPTAFSWGDKSPDNNVWYALCPGTGGTDDKKTGAPNITIESGGKATLTVEQTGNIGQGFKITYDTDKVCYIEKVVDSQHFYVGTALGADPDATESKAVVSIAAPFASLYAAEDGASGEDYLNTADLVTATTTLNLCCYAGASADTTDVTISGYTTSADYYINVYTPTGGTQSLSSQRHAGVYDTDKYRLYVAPDNGGPLVIGDPYVTINGLQVEYYGSGNNRSIIALTSSGTRRVEILTSIIRGVSATGTGCYGIHVGGSAANTVTIRNCTITGPAGTGSRGILSTSNAMYGNVQNCTISGSAVAIQGGSSGGFYVTNCAIFNNGDDIVSGVPTYCAIDDEDSFTGKVDISPGETEADDWASAFTDYANGNFTVKDTDSVLYGAGTDLSATFTTDIVGAIRSSWDIGAFEYVSD